MKNKKFSLIEVLLATVILSAGAVLYSKISAQSANMVYEGESQWGRAHLKSLACEYYLLWGADAPEPVELLPENYSASCELIDEHELLEQSEDQTEGRWTLKKYWVQLYYKDEVIDETYVSKFLPVELVQ